MKTLILGLILLATAGVASAQQPDFTGVWTTYTDPGPGPGGGGGGRGGGPPLPLNDMAKQKVAKYQALVQPTGDTPGGFCLGTGMPGSMLGSGGYPMEIHQRPEQIIIVYEAHNEVRRVYLGDRIVPEVDRLPGRNGHSSGRWEGNTLVVETGNLVEQVDQRYAAQQQSEDRRTVSSRQGRQGRDRAGRRDDDERSRVLHGAVHDREEVGEGAERALAAVRVRRGELDQAPGAAREEGRRSQEAEASASAESTDHETTSSSSPRPSSPAAQR